MNLYTVMTQVGNALDTIAGLNVFKWQPGALPSHSAVVMLPELIEYNSTAARGLDRISDLQVLVVVARPTERRAVEDIAAYAAGSGAKSVVAAVQNYAYADSITVTVRDVTFPQVSSGSVPMLGAQFSLIVDGPGA